MRGTRTRKGIRRIGIGDDKKEKAVHEGRGRENVKM
jgi:hypothetical protein